MSEKDKIPLESDYIKQREAMAKWSKEHPNPRHKYIATYVWNGMKRTEEIWEINAETAEQWLKSEWAKIGVNLKDIEIKEG